MCVTTGMFSAPGMWPATGSRVRRESSVVLGRSDVDEVPVDVGARGIVDRRDAEVGVAQTWHCPGAARGRHARARSRAGPRRGCRRRAPGCRHRGDAAATTPEPPRRSGCRRTRPRGRRRRLPTAGSIARGRRSSEADSALFGVPRSRELALEVDVDRVGEMTLDVLRPPLGRVEAPAHVEQAHGRPESRADCSSRGVIRWGIPRFVAREPVSASGPETSRNLARRASRSAARDDFGPVLPRATHLYRV